MAIIHFEFDPVLTKDFLDFGYDLYCGDPNWIPPIRRTLSTQFSPDFPFYQKPGNRHRHILATAGKKVVGRLSAMVNKDLRDGDGTPVGTLGFFECIHDTQVAKDLFDSGVGWLSEEQGRRRIWGPMNFDIWHEYRLMTNGFDQKPFYGEPYNKHYYPDLFHHYGFTAKQYWDSVEVRGRETLERMIARGQERYRILTDRGYGFEQFNPRYYGNEVCKLHQLVTKSYGEFLGFTPISLTAFEDLFAKSRYALVPHFFVFVHDEYNHLAGFGAAFLELSDAIRAMKGKDNFFAKVTFLWKRRSVNRINFYLGGVTPAEAAKKTGLGRAGFYYVINRILNEGFESVLFTLRVKGNRATGLLGKEAPKPQREYALYELNR